jgi:hypothetical protein
VKGNIETALFFMDHPMHLVWMYEGYIDFEINFFHILCALGHCILIEKLLSTPHHNDLLFWASFQQGLGHAICNNHFDVFQLLLADPRFTAPDLQVVEIQDEGLNEFLGIEDLDLGPGINFQSRLNMNLYDACEYGRIMMVAMLLADERSDPNNTMRGRCLRVACENGHLDVVKLLLEDSRYIDPSGFDNEAIKAALGNKHSDIVAFLLGDLRVSSTFTQ